VFRVKNCNKERCHHANGNRVAVTDCFNVLRKGVGSQLGRGGGQVHLFDRGGKDSILGCRSGGGHSVHSYKETANAPRPVGEKDHWGGGSAVTKRK